MEKHVDDNICSLLAPTCPSESTTSTAAPTTTPGDYRGTTFTPGGCLHQRGQCGVGGRRLEAAESRNRFLEAIGASPAKKAESDPDISCAEFDPTFYKAQEETTVTHESPDADHQATVTSPPDEQLLEASGAAHAYRLGGASLSAFLFFLTRRA